MYYEIPFDWKIDITVNSWLLMIEFSLIEKFPVKIPKNRLTFIYSVWN